MQKTVTWLLSLVLLVGVGVLGYAGYGFIETKYQAHVTANAADRLLSERNPALIHASGEQPDTSLVMNWQEKEAFMPSLVKGEAFGKLLLPKIDGELPIVEGVDANDLAKGVGHDADTLLPLDGGQTVLSGHRDTVFRGIGELAIGDTMIVQLPYGDFEYRITETKIVDADDRTIIVPHDNEVLTVTTCYPFDFIGYAPDRYIIYAEPTFDMSELEAHQALQDENES